MLRNWGGVSMCDQIKEFYKPITNYNKLQTGKHIHLNEPKIFHDEITQTYRCVNKLSVQINQMAETHIIQSIIDYAKEQGITDLFLINEDFVKSALLNEKARREKQKPKPTNFDVITQNVDSFIKWVLDNYNSVPPNLDCKASCNKDCGECFKNWLLQDAE